MGCREWGGVAEVARCRRRRYAGLRGLSALRSSLCAIVYDVEVTRALLVLLAIAWFAPGPWAVGTGGKSLDVSVSVPWSLRQAMGQIGGRSSEA